MLRQFFLTFKTLQPMPPIGLEDGNIDFFVSAQIISRKDIPI